MKRIHGFTFLLVLMLVMSNCLLLAQTKPVIIVKAGGNVSNMLMTDSWYNVTPDPKIGYTIGATVDIPVITKNWFVRSGLNYTVKGASIDEYDFVYKPVLKFLQVPLNMGYRYDFGSRDFAVAASAGPYLAYGVGGKMEFGSRLGTFNLNSFDYFKRFDLGFNFDAAVEYKRFVGGILFDMGVLDLSKDTSFEDYRINDGMYLSTVNFSFYVGLKF